MSADAASVATVIGAAPASIASSRSALLQITGLTKTFGAQRALDEVDLHIRRGEIHALLGQNGSGKSTLIKVLAGYHRPDPGSGQAVLAGKPLELGSRSASRAAGLRFIHQDLGLVGELDSVDNLALGQRYQSRAWLSDRRERSRAQAVLDRYGIAIDVTRNIDSLSAAQRSLLAVVRALTQQSSTDGLLVLDEATATLPANDARTLFALLRTLRDEGQAILFVTHRLAEVFEIADTVTVLRDGRRTATAAVDDITQEGLIELIIGKTLEAFYPSPPVPRRDVVLDVRGVGGGMVSGVNLAVHEGEVLGVTGLVGSGFDELLPIIYGARPRSAGTITVKGLPVRPSRVVDAVRAGIAYVPADRKSSGGILSWTVRENATLNRLPTRGKLRWLSRRTEVRVVSTILDQLQVVPPDPERALSTLSGGNQQKVIMARWLRDPPAVLLLDEPTNGVDTGAKQTIYQALADSAVSGSAVLVASSDLEELCAICDRVLVLRNGRLAAEVSGADLTQGRLAQESLRVDEPPQRHETPQREGANP